MNARDIAILEEFALTPFPGGAKGISLKVGEGRDAVQTAINNLKNAGYLETTTNAMVNGRVIKTTQLTAAGNQFLETRSYTILTKLNSNLLLRANSLLPNSESSSREETHVEYYETEEERNAAKEKYRAAKHKEKMEHHEARREERMIHRSIQNAVNWSTTDSTFEFAEQMHKIWHIQPWKVTRSRFRYALANKRKEYNTNGEVERQMMLSFFASIQHDTKLNDGEIVWKKFILEFDRLHTEYEQSMVTPEEMEQIKLDAEKSWEGF